MDRYNEKKPETSYPQSSFVPSLGTIFEEIEVTTFTDLGPLKVKIPIDISVDDDLARKIDIFKKSGFPSGLPKLEPILNFDLGMDDLDESESDQLVSQRDQILESLKVGKKEVVKEDNLAQEENDVVIDNHSSDQDDKVEEKEVNSFDLPVEGLEDEEEMTEEDEDVIYNEDDLLLLSYLLIFVIILFEPILVR